MEGEVGWDALGSEGAGVFLFVQELDGANPYAVVVEVELLGVVHRVSELDFLPDVCGRHLIEGAFEANGGIVIDDPFVANEEDLIEFGLGEASEFYPGYGCVVAVDGFIADAVMELVVVIFLESKPKSLVEVLARDALLDSGREAFPDSPKEAFYFSA